MIRQYSRNSLMKVALVHDYLSEYGGAERVLEALAEIYPEAPIYTAFAIKDSPAQLRFRDREIITSWAQKIPGFASKLHSPLRFLTPYIWESFNFDEFDVVISSASWYITKGILTRPDTLHICYCHTPPRYLYGLETSRNWQKNWFVRQYARLVNPGLREYDYLAAQRVDFFVANSENTKKRIEKFYRREAEVIYPPVSLSDKVSKRQSSEGYLFTGGRLVAPKHFDLVIQAANQLRLPLKVFGDGPERSRLEALAGGTVEFLGKVDESKLASLYAGARVFVTLAADEDFGITPVEATASGTPVVAYRAGGYLETVIEGTTGEFVDSLDVNELVGVIKKTLGSRYKQKDLKKQAKKFSKDRFVREIKGLVEQKWEERQK